MLQHGHPGSLWASATSGQQPLLDALDVLITCASWHLPVLNKILCCVALLLLQHGHPGSLWASATSSLC
jgi:hypothetical protein